ncbi:winged helix-turn-helix transcriptional regulator, Rrf2 family [Citrifermentans bemidjiense Bem]|uniref:Winged helix-turn-helix transcriptional regulator, Rrf2 family n=1 Tax=Citrifermentans bemidjiense (strain ATCC BAA-1014 / DSM 16622 / JCM 12645 / Bem) TaxID=404380 RepID=B5E894_CITBB|nr:Rrf2 family transcriptional regulator [Citrifermentans bemidjiense]ACH40063.1 winged helix-turn-helix transcriptional regulator, Rrf2 family [Citrifermentans bemidjiense Bem]
MQFSVGVEYALHSLFYLVNVPEGKTVGIRHLAELHGSTDSYLSKIFAKLRKTGIVRSVSGVKGGYELARLPEAISFWDIIEAVEGPSYFFQCNEMRKKNIFVSDPSIFTDRCPCLIKVVIQDAENVFRNELRNKSLRWLWDQAQKDFSEERKLAIRTWTANL